MKLDYLASVPHLQAWHNFRRSEGKKQARVQQSPGQDYARKGIRQGELMGAFGLELLWLLFSDGRAKPHETGHEACFTMR
jgi:hypothetical protein